jgi:glycosyltransferase involved in cell wall biosynthesis
MKYFKETIACAREQDYQNLEIVICDDHSTDGTFEFSKRLAKEDYRVRVFRNDKNVGLVQNWINSIMHAQGEWIKFLFQDDLMASDTVSRMVNQAVIHDVGIVVCDREYFFESGYDEKLKRFYNEKLPKTSLIFPECRAYSPEETASRIKPYVFKNCMGEPPCFMFKKEGFDVSDMPLDFKQLIDYVFILRKILNEKFVYIPKKLVKFRVHNTSESKRNSTVNQDNKDSLYKYYYIKYYEKLLLAYQIKNDTAFASLDKCIDNTDIEILKTFFILQSYKNEGFKKIYDFYRSTDISNFLISPKTNSYSYLKYKTFKIRHKNIIKRYRI